MGINSDLREFVRLLNLNNVEYIIVGAYALAYHGAPRYTGDIDLLIKMGRKNASRIVTAINEFGFASLGLTEEDFLEPNMVIQLGQPPFRIDILTSITSVSWTEAERGAEFGEYEGLKVRYLGKQEYIKNKKALGRKKDLADIEALEND